MLCIYVVYLYLILFSPIFFVIQYYFNILYFLLLLIFYFLLLYMSFHFNYTTHSSPSPCPPLTPSPRFILLHFLLTSEISHIVFPFVSHLTRIIFFLYYSYPFSTQISSFISLSFFFFLSLFLSFLSQ